MKCSGQLRILVILVLAGLLPGCSGGGGGASPAPPAAPPPAMDTVPDQFSFTDVENAALGAVVVSNEIIVSGINIATNISVTGGEYAIGSGAFTSTSGTVSNGNRVRVRGTAAATYDTERDVDLTIGGVSDTFSIATGTAPTVTVSVNIDIKHSVGGAEAFDRQKFITVHSSNTGRDWFGGNSQSLGAPNAIADLMSDFMDGFDVYFGRDTGLMLFRLNQLPENPAMPGFVDGDAMTTDGGDARSLYTDDSGPEAALSRAHEDRQQDAILAAHLHPYWPDGQQTNQGWAFSQVDSAAEPFGSATGDFFGQYLLKYFNRGSSDPDGQPKPRYMEVVNEPLYDLVDTAAMAEPFDKIFQFHKTVADRIRATVAAFPGDNNDVLIGGYTAAFPDFEKNGFQRWVERHKRFIDLVGTDMDFISIHLYDFAGIQTGGATRQQYRKGSNVEATFDLLEAYSESVLGAPAPLVVSEYGARIHVMENQPWSAERDGIQMRGIDALQVQMMERPHLILKAVPFIVLKAEWGRTSVPYPWRLLRQAKEAGGQSGEEWVYTDLVKHYQLWANVRGTRVDTFATDPDIQVDAYLEGDRLHLILNSLEFEDTRFDLELLGLGGVQVDRATVRHLHTDGSGNPVLEETILSDLSSTITLGAEATMIIEIELGQGVTPSETSTETKVFSPNMLVPIVASQQLDFSVDGLSLGAQGEAMLRLAVGRDHGLSLTPAIMVNSVAVAVPADFRGYDQDLNGTGRESFFGVIEIPVPYSALQTNNTVSVTFPDGGGHISTLGLQVFEQTRVVVRP